MKSDYAALPTAWYCSGELLKTPYSESSIQTDTMSHITNLVPRPSALQFGKLTIFNKI